MRTADLNPTRARPVRAEGFSPESAGQLFPEKTYPQPQGVHALDQAKALLIGLGGETLFQVSSTLKARGARPFGAFPEDSQPLPLNLALGIFRDSLTRIGSAISRKNQEATFTALGHSLDAMHALAKEGEVSAPLHAWMPHEDAQDALARITLSYAELAGGEKAQRRALHYLDHLVEDLPDPLKGEATTPRQRLVRMLALIYTGRALDRSRTLQEAIKQYENALEINDLHQPGIEDARLTAYAELIELRFKRVGKLFAERKHKRSLEEIEEILSLRGRVEQKLPLAEPRYREAMIAMRSEIGARLWGMGLVAKAHSELYGIQQSYSSGVGAETLKELLAATPVSEKRRGEMLGHFLSADSGLMRAPEELGELSLGTRLAIRLTHTIANARRHKPLKTFMTWAGGAAGAAGAVYAAAGGDAHFADLLAASGAGAAIFDGAARLYNGATSSETAEAIKIGLDDISPKAALRSSGAFAAGSLLPYLIFGGRVPGIGALADVPILGGAIEAASGSSVAAGSINGPGSIVSGAIAALSGEAAAVLAGGSGQAGYGAHFSQTTLGSTLIAAWDTYAGALSSLADGSFKQRVAAAATDALSSDSWQKGLIAYQAASLGYYLASRLSRGFRERFNHIGPAFVPGGLLLAANMGEALGATPGNVELGPVTLPLNLIGTATVGAGYQILGQTLIGNRSFREVQWYNVIGASGIINAYVGVSNNFAPAVKSEGFSQMVAESVGRQIGMIPIIVAHGGALMVNPRRFAQNKAARLLAYDHFGNVTRIAMGQWDGFLPVLTGVSIGFFITNSLLGCTFNDLAGSRPAAQSFRTMLANANGQAGDGMMKAMARSMRRIPPAAAITKMGPGTLTLPARVFVDSMKGRKLAPFMLPEESTLAMYHELLMTRPEDGGLNRRQLDAFLDAGRRFLDSPEDADIARGLMLVLSAAQEGPHGSKISGFMAGNRDMHAKLRVPREAVRLPEQRRQKEQELLGMLQHPFRVCPANTPVNNAGMNMAAAFNRSFGTPAPALMNFAAIRPVI